MTNNKCLFSIQWIACKNIINPIIPGWNMNTLTKKQKEKIIECTNQDYLLAELESLRDYIIHRIFCKKQGAKILKKMRIDEMKIFLEELNKWSK